MATTRKRKTSATGFSAPVEEPAPTHEEMLEVAAEREEEAVEVAEDIDHLQEFLDVMAEDAFSNLGEQDFFEPTPPPEPLVIHAPAVGTGPKLRLPKKQPERTTRGLPKKTIRG